MIFRYLGRSFREIVRQQWNFGPPGTIREVQDYAVDLSDVTVVELEIVPDKRGGETRATLESCVWRRKQQQTWSDKWEQWR
jgi:hypothetical protein